MSLSNLFSNIQNGQRKHILVINQPRSKITEAVLKVLQENGFIRGFRYQDWKYEASSFSKVKGKNAKVMGLEILLKYNQDKPLISKIKMVSKPSKRVYKNYCDIKKTMLVSDMENFPVQGLWVLSTSKGILSHIQALKYKIGGEVICHVV